MDFDAQPPVCGPLAENTIDFLSDLRPLVMSSVLVDQLVSSVAVINKANSEMRVASSNKSSRTRKNASILGQEKLKLLPPACVGRKVYFSRSKAPSMTASAVA